MKIVSLVLLEAGGECFRNTVWEIRLLLVVVVLVLKLKHLSLP